MNVIFLDIDGVLNYDEYFNNYKTKINFTVQKKNGQKMQKDLPSLKKQKKR